MAQSNFSPEQIQEMRDMRLNEKKAPKEIIQAFKDKYQLTLFPWQVSYYCKAVAHTAAQRKAKKATGGGRRQKRSWP